MVCCCACVRHPAECAEFPDYSFDEHFGKAVGSFPPHAAMTEYFSARAERAGVRPWCRFRTAVRLVTFEERTSRFTLTAHDLLGDRVYSEV
jgi:trimethylamine monooxygenase